MSFCHCREVSLSSEIFSATSGSIPSGWFHTVINFIGPDEGEGIRIYHDGVSVANGTTKSYLACDQSACRPDGRIVVGRDNTRIDTGYCSLQVDELAFFNKALSQEEITMLSQHTENNEAANVVATGSIE